MIGEGFMQAESQENYDLWFGIFREIGEECKDMEGCKKKGKPLKKSVEKWYNS